MLIILLLLALWVGLFGYGVRRWRHALAASQRDAQLKALLSGSLVPGPRVPGMPPGRRAELPSADVALRTGAVAAG